MKVSIEYLPKDDIGKKKYPDVSYEVYVPDGMTDEEIAKLYESKHTGIHHVGIRVLNIEHLD